MLQTLGAKNVVTLHKYALALLPPKLDNEEGFPFIILEDLLGAREVTLNYQEEVCRAAIALYPVIVCVSGIERLKVYCLRSTKVRHEKYPLKGKCSFAE
jgi:hypothetical protein